MKNCGTCKHWQLLYYEENNLQDDDLGRCKAMDNVKLPYAWSYATREIIQVNRADGLDCSCWEFNGDIQ